jgi:hypothetical protein
MTGTRLGADAFTRLNAAVDLINQYSSQQTSARASTESALGLPLPGAEGAALKPLISAVRTALSDSGLVTDDLIRLFDAADAAMGNIRNVDEVAHGLFRDLGDTVKPGNVNQLDQDQGRLQQEQAKAQRLAARMAAEQRSAGTV